MVLLNACGLFLTGCNFDSNNVAAEPLAPDNSVGYVIDSYDVKKPDKHAKKVVKSYDTDSSEDVTHITVLSALTDAAESALNTVADHVKLRKDKEKEKDNTNSGAITANSIGNYKKGKKLGNFKLTAYCPCRSCSGGYGRSTTLGPKARAKHTIAADRRVLKLGTWVIINDQLYRVEDTGSAVKGNVIDIFFDHHSETNVFGVRHADVYLAVKK